MLTFCARAFVLVAMLAAPHAANAADAVFPPGSRIGIVPPEGMKVAAEFLGFESDDKNVKFGFAELPVEAFASVEAAIKEGKGAGNGLKPEPMKTETGDAFFTAESKTEAGVTVRNYSLIAKGDTFTAYVIAQVKESGKAPPDAEIRKSLSSVMLRKEVPTAEQLDLLPFKVGDIGGFKTVRSLPNRTAVLLSDGDDTATLDNAAYMVIAVVPGRPETPEDKARFAQQAATTIPGLRNARITSSEPIRIDGTPGYETRIEAVTGKNDAPVMLVQWIRFGSQTALRIVGSSAKDEWPKAFPRFRAVRDSVAPK